ncbi:DAK2 domain-containing protein [Chloroflexi bacterium TSY]|nr:DAK2 domain-containing protein [Chloroflexi bacterium TSY]
MSQHITINQLQHWLLLYAQRLIEEEATLTRLDAAIGDADHGVNMQRGAERLRQRIGWDTTFSDASILLRTAAMTLINGIGGAAGALYGSFFLHAAKCAAQSHNRVEKVHESHNHPESDHLTDLADDILDLEQVAKIFRAGLEGVKQRGKAKVGEKTMIDAMEPAIIALEVAFAKNLSVVTAFMNAQQAAKKGMERTIELEATKGRASYLGPRSIGHQDPGATSTFYLFDVAIHSFGIDRAV